MDSKENVANLSKAYLSRSKVLVLDTSPITFEILGSVFKKYEIEPSKFLEVRSIPEAQNALGLKEFNVFVFEHRIQGADSIELKRLLTEEHGEENLSILVSSNISQFLISKVAEEEIDAFILKPLDADVFSKILFESIFLKMEPSDYKKFLNEGVHHLNEGQLDEALASFTQATQLHTEPALAFFRLAQVHQKKNDLPLAIQALEGGLKYNPIHFKCLLLLFELYSEAKKTVEAYEILKRLAKYYPSNPERLALLIRLAVTTSQFSDIEKLYQSFVSSPYKTDRLRLYIVSALLISGKHLVIQKKPKRATDLFEKAMALSPNEGKNLNYVLDTLLENSEIEHAREMYNKYSTISPEIQNNEIYSILR